MKAWWVHAYTKCVAALCSRRSSPWPFGVISWGPTRWPSPPGVDKVLQRSGALHGARRLAQLFTDDTTARCVHAGAKKQAFSAVAETVRLYRAFIWWPGHKGKLPILLLHPRIQLYHPQDDPFRHVVFSFCRLAVLSSISARALSCSCYVCYFSSMAGIYEVAGNRRKERVYDTIPCQVLECQMQVIVIMNIHHFGVHDIVA